MALLLPFLPFMADETVLSWAARLAKFHTGGRLVPFLHDIGLQIEDLIGGATRAIERLCDLTGQDADIVLHNAVQRDSHRRYALRGEVFSVEFMTGRDTSFCPLCLAEDEAAGSHPHAWRRGRLSWALRSTRTCPIHQLPLLERKRDTWDDIAHELSVKVPETGPALRALADGLRTRSPSPLQSYVVERLEGKHGSGWLDTQGIEQAARATEMLGAVLLFGPKADRVSLTSTDWDDAGRAGWECVQNGETGITEALTHLQDEAKAAHRGRMLGNRSTFGMLYDWLASPKLRKDPGPIRDIVRDHIIATTDVGPGETLMGQPVERRELYSVTSLAKCYHVDPRTLRSVLVAKGTVPPEAANSLCSGILVAADAGEEVAQSVQRAIPVSDVPNLLGVSRPMVQALIDAGLLPLLRGDGFKTGKLSCAVDRVQLDALRVELERRAEIVETAPSNMVTLAKAAERSRTKLSVILELLFEGRLRRVRRVASDPGFAGVLVDHLELKALFGNVRPGMSTECAFMMLGIRRTTGEKLIGDFAGTPLLKTERTRDRDCRWVTPDAIDSFRRIYLTAKQLRLESPHSSSRLEHILREHGVTPAFDHRKLGANLYRRADLPPACFRES